jgi:mannose-6-phosphate isomerase
MSTLPLPPLHFEPILKRHIWGGRQLGTLLRKPIGNGSDYAESWEISDHHNDVSKVADGPLAGTSLRELIRTRRKELLGQVFEEAEEFPLLVKFIDAHRNLSVQVHPNDEQAKRLANDNGKTEAWVVSHVEPGSLIYAGLKPGVTRESFAEAVKQGAVEDLLHSFTPQVGDCILIPAGTVHAIGAGVLVTEIQQMSDTTFRIFDWNRTGPDGNPRELHIRQALEVIDFSRGPVDPWNPTSKPIDGGGSREQLASCPHFSLERLTLSHPTEIGSPERFTIAIGLAGSANLNGPMGEVSLEYGRTLLLPASLGTCLIAPAGSEATVILSCIVP